MNVRGLTGLLGGAALIVVPVPAIAGSAPTNAVPPVAQSAESPSKTREAVDSLSDVNSTTNILHNAAGAVGESNGLVDKTMGTQSKRFLDGKTKALDYVSNGLTTYEVVQKARSGDYSGAIRQGSAEVIDQVIDKCYTAATTAACAYISAPSGEALFPACETAAVAVKFCADKVIEDKLGGSLGEVIVKKSEEFYDKASMMFAEKQAEQNQQTQSQRSQFSAAQTSNDQQAIALAGAQAAAAPSGNSGDDGGAFAAALMSGIMVMSEQQSMQHAPAQTGHAPSQAPLATPQAAPTAIGGPCHTGHDENAHPGGCHKGSGTSR